MSDVTYSIVFSSATGNTRMLAEAIKETLPQESCNYFGGCEDVIPKSDLLFVGFWTDKGAADETTLNLLESLKNRKLFLFGTAGFGGSESYFQSILEKTRAHIDDSNNIVGEFVCQGKMRQSVRDRYVKMQNSPDCPPNIDMLIENFDKALTHPDADDLAHLAQRVKEAIA